MTAPTLSVAELAELERLTKAAAALGLDWSPETIDHEGGGTAALPRLHRYEDTEGCQDIDAEQDGADTDLDYLRAFDPQTVLALLAAAQRLARLESALDFLEALDEDDVSPPCADVDQILKYAAEFGWRFPEVGSDAESTR